MTYTICSEWTDCWQQPYLPFRIQTANLTDGRGRTYSDGACRVLDSRTGKRISQTFKGELAPARAEILARDLCLAERYS